MTPSRAPFGDDTCHQRRRHNRPSGGSIKHGSSQIGQPVVRRAHAGKARSQKFKGSLPMDSLDDQQHPGAGTHEVGEEMIDKTIP